MSETLNQELALLVTNLANYERDSKVGQQPDFVYIEP